MSATNAASIVADVAKELAKAKQQFAAAKAIRNPTERAKALVDLSNSAPFGYAENVKEELEPLIGTLSGMADELSGLEAEVYDAISDAESDDDYEGASDRRPVTRKAGGAHSVYR